MQFPKYVIENVAILKCKSNVGAACIMMCNLNIPELVIASPFKSKMY